MITRRAHTVFLVKCDYCGRVGHDMYHFTANGNAYKVCGNDHALQLEEKLKGAK